MENAIDFNSDNGINFDMFSSESANMTGNLTSVQVDIVDDQEKKKRGRPKKEDTVINTVETSNGAFVPATQNQSQQLNFVYTNNTYDTTYNDTNLMLKNTVGQIDTLAYELKQQLDLVMSSKTLKSKYQVIPQLGSSIGSMLATKIQAIKEINKTTTDAHNLELKRIKDLNLGSASEKKDDDQMIMDMYNAFIQNPYGNTAGVPYTPQQLSTVGVVGPSGPANMIRALDDPNATYNNYVQNMTPEQNAMRLEHNPNVKTVVVYDKNTGNRYFDIRDMTTGQSVPNVSRPDAMFLEDTNIDVRNRIARNTNLNQTYPLVIIGDSLDQY